MKILSLLIFTFLSACSFIVQDPLTPDERATVAAVRATETVEAALLAIITPTLTPELPPLPPLPTPEPEVLPEALIKGNISKSGEKIYHVPGQANYDNVIIDPDHGEKYFYTEDEAIEAGWRKALR